MNTILLGFVNGSLFLYSSPFIDIPLIWLGISFCCWFSNPASFRASLTNFLSKNLYIISKWGEENLVDFNALNTLSWIVISKIREIFANIIMYGKTLNRIFVPWLSLSLDALFHNQNISSLLTGLKNYPYLSTRASCNLFVLLYVPIQRRKNAK